MEKGSNLIFLACQPRSGSTLLQKMLGAHPEIHTTSEPWVMLPPAYSLRENGTQAEYDWNLAQVGLRTFLDELPNGKEGYLNGLRRMYGYLYRRALQGTGASRFLDKTPRYYLILSELKEIFPEAHFILLFRNPLAVLSSVIRTWIGPNWLKLANFEDDLVEAPGLLVNSKDRLGSRAISVRYENVVQEPVQTMKEICHSINVGFDPCMVRYGEGRERGWKMGDQETVYERKRPETSSLEKWKNTENAQEWRLLRDYAEVLGAGAFDELGYDYDACMKVLESKRPSKAKLRYTLSMDWLMKKGKGESTRWRHHTVQVLNGIRDEGILAIPRHIFSNLSR